MPRKSLNKLATIATAAAFLTDGPAVGALVSGAKNKNAATKTHLWAGREDVESNLMQVDASKNSNRGKSSKGRTTQDTCELELDALRDSHLSTVCEDESLSLVDLLVTLPEGGRWKPCVDDSGKSGPNPYPDFQDGSKRRCPLGVEVQCVSGKKQGKPVQLCEGCGNGYWDGCGDGCHREEHVKLVEGHEIKNVCVSGSAGAAWDGGFVEKDTNGTTPFTISAPEDAKMRDSPIDNFQNRRGSRGGCVEKGKGRWCELEEKRKKKYQTPSSSSYSNKNYLIRLYVVDYVQVYYLCKPPQFVTTQPVVWFSLQILARKIHNDSSTLIHERYLLTLTLT